MISRLLLVFTAAATIGLSTPADAGQRLFFQATGSLASDFDNDGAVGFGDFLEFATRFGSVVGEAAFDVRFDLDKDGIVNFGDFLLFADAFGTTSTPPLSTPDLALYILDPGTSSIDIYNFKNHLAQSFLPFRNPGSFKISSDHERMYVNEQFGMFALDDAHQVLYSVPGTVSGQLVLHPDETFAYAAEFPNNLVRVIDLTAHAVADTIAVGSRPGKMAVSPNGRWLYVANASDISVVDLNQNKEVLRLDVEGSVGAIVIDPTGSRAYYTVTNRATVGVLDVGTNATVGEIQLEGDDVSDIKFSPDGSRLYVSTTRALVEIDVSRNLVVRSLEIADGTSTIGLTPDGLHAYVGALEPLIFDPGLAVIDLTQWRLLGRIRGFVFPAEIAFRRTSFGDTVSDASQQLP